ncbi:MAG: hypothetical protein AB7F43_08690 [Bacteriovoracia bacterium]
MRSFRGIFVLLCFCVSAKAWSCSEYVEVDQQFYTVHEHFRSLNNTEKKSLDDLRREIAYASYRYHGAQDINEIISANRSLEGRVLIPKRVENGHAIYFASGADVYRLLYDFPGADHFHYVDIMLGWGSGPQDIIGEFERRIRSIDPYIQTQIVDFGFVAHLGFEKLDFLRNGFEDESNLEEDTKKRNEFKKTLMSDAGARRPLIFEAQWYSPGQGPQKKRFYLHPMDFTRSEQIDELLNSIPQEHELVGMIEAGWTGSPHPEDIKKMLDRASADAAFVFEEFVDIGFDREQYFKESQGFLGDGLTLELVEPTKDDMEASVWLGSRMPGKRRYTADLIIRKGQP